MRFRNLCHQQVSDNYHPVGQHELVRTVVPRSWNSWTSRERCLAQRLPTSSK